MLNQYTLVDLTHTIHEGIPTWTGEKGFSVQQVMDYSEGAKVYHYECVAGIGTHMDAPSHFFPGGKTVATIELKDLLVKGYRLDVSNKKQSDLFIEKKDIVDFEKENGKIEPNSFFIGYTGWQDHWNNPTLYRNLDEKGIMHFPGFSKEAAELLLEREVVGIGIDTLSPDGSNLSYPVHILLLGAGKYLVENLCNLDKLPSKGFFVFLFPLKIQEGSESPIRAVGLIPKN